MTNNEHARSYTNREASTTEMHAGVEMDLKEYLEIQRREIERHKWIESEKAGRDLGMDAAIDWILKYADVFSDNLGKQSES
ncbi:MAG: hypothetical protein HY913_20705 [Desulfomonile tiedjei]|nr:hypothetical protein [Desulfomonile tiedjei]